MAYVHNLDIEKNVKPKMDKFCKKFIFLGGLQTWMVDTLLKLPKSVGDVVNIIKIAESTLANGFKRKSDGTSQQSSLSQISPKAKSAGSLDYHTNTNGKPKAPFPTSVTPKDVIHAILRDKENGFVVPRQIMFLLGPEC